MCLLVLLAGCETAPKRKPLASCEVVVLKPPAADLMPTPVPAKPTPFGIEAWVGWTGALREAVAACNDDKAATRGWVEEQR